MQFFSYLATCPAGFENEAARLIAHEWQGSSVIRCSGGAVWFSLPFSLPPASIPEYVTNVFFILREWNTSANPFSELVKQSARKSALGGLPPEYAPKSYRVRFSRENPFESVDKGVAAAAERFISAETGAQADRLGSGGEYWFIIRSEAWSAFALRLEKSKASAAAPVRGELSAALASLIVLRSARDRHPRAILDPCAGHGALPERVLAFFPDATVFARDIDGGAVDFLKKRFSGTSRVSVEQGDLRTLAGIPDSSVDLVITDPPWGMWEEGGYRDGAGIAQLYVDLLRSAERVLTAGGRLCVLTGAKRDFEAAAAGNARFAQAAQAPDFRTDILVNGKKAALYVLDA